MIQRAMLGIFGVVTSAVIAISFSIGMAEFGVYLNELLNKKDESK